MRFSDTALPGVKLIAMESVGDSRGHFARTFCAREFAAQGLNPEIAQASVSFNARKGTLRGLHFQCNPAMEDKLVRCIRGAIFDVMVDIRTGSPTFGRWVAYDLTEDNSLQLYAPKGFAHGFQALTDNVMVSYHIAQFYEPARSTGVRWDDPDVGISWPLPPVEQSPRDLTLPRLKEIDPTQLMSFADSR
jgi:dTDP-4-dehydrorhamnose 3,5-epimerase